ncbi:MAG: alpha/beta fold hydrolase [Chloroflexi bacterium]|nr:alpha/beta fold hydrolase [Chloroflexota bacterium]
MSVQPPSPEPIFLKGGPVGVLLIHGFTGAPPEMRLIGDYLHGKGMTVSAPLLPGHGRTVADMSRHSWQEWTSHVQNSLDKLREQCEQLFVAGLSLGSLLTLYLAINNAEIRGIILYSPPLWLKDKSIYLTPFLKHFIKSRPKPNDTDLTDPQAPDRLWSYEENPVASAHELLKLIRYLRPRLADIQTPALIIYSKRDRVIHPQSAQRLFDQLGTEDKELIPLHNSGHCLTVDTEWRSVAERTATFIQQHSQKMT